jgi:hypothetical protein
MRLPTPSDTSAALHSAILRINGRAWGWAFGLVAGVGLFAATITLVLRGGDNPGQHLALLAQFFPGYRVSVLGACIGFIYAFVTGYATGRVVGLMYNVGLGRDHR